MITFINYYTVFIYGFLIMIFLLNIKKSKQNIFIFVLYSISFGIILFELFNLFSIEFIIKFYPFIIHLPLILFFYFYFKKTFPSIIFVLCVAYILTTPRKWLGEFTSLLIKGNTTATLILKILVSIIILFIVYKFIRPTVNKIISYSGKKLVLLTIIPFIYYLVAYTTTVYTNLLYSSSVLVVGLLSTILTYTLFAFLIVYFNELEKKFSMQNDQNILKIQSAAKESQLNQIKESQNEMIIYRHDLRHHLNLLDSYIASGNNAEARIYIAKINNNMDKFVIKKYCENETINSIISFYISHAEFKNIAVDLNVLVPNHIFVDTTDICVIFANALENAINAVDKVLDKNNRRINISVYYNNSKLYIEIINPFQGEILFEDELPYTKEKNHGTGTKSIVLACKKYQGIYSFEAENGIFTLRIILSFF